MLLTIFSATKKFAELERKLSEGTKKVSSSHYEKIFPRADDDSDIIAVAFSLEEKTFLTLTTYNLKLAKTLAQTIDNTFDIFRFDDRLFRTFFDISKQVVQCEYVYQGIERKSTAIDLKGMAGFKKRLDESHFLSMTFSIEGFDVIITAREEGRISVSPDIDTGSLVNLFRLLLTYHTRSIAG